METNTNNNVSQPVAGSSTAAGGSGNGASVNNTAIPQAQSGYTGYPQLPYGYAQNPVSGSNSQNAQNGTVYQNQPLPLTSSLPYSPYNNSGNVIQYQGPAQSGIRTIQPLNTPLQNDETTPETLTNPIFIPGFLRQNIGRWVRVEFLIGNTLTDRVGILTEVGASYILLQSIDPNSYILCDMFSIKFVVIINTDNYGSLLTGQ